MVEVWFVFVQGEVVCQKVLLVEGIVLCSQYEVVVIEVWIVSDVIVVVKVKSESLCVVLLGNVVVFVEVQFDVCCVVVLFEKVWISLGDMVVCVLQDGVVIKVNQLQVGNYVIVGCLVFMFIGMCFWVVVNFKEDQFCYMWFGQFVVIEFDVFFDCQICGWIVSFSLGIGNSFVVFLVENVIGNWVKVVQWLLVEISIDEVFRGFVFVVGFSVDVKVDIGYKCSLFGLGKVELGVGRQVLCVVWLLLYCFGCLVFV